MQIREFCVENSLQKGRCIIYVCETQYLIICTYYMSTKQSLLNMTLVGRGLVFIAFQKKKKNLTFLYERIKINKLYVNNLFYICIYNNKCNRKTNDSIYSSFLTNQRLYVIFLISTVTTFTTINQKLKKKKTFTAPRI
uniref:F14J16.1 n=1 Tax=Arabidopsis thaliana TaxID=3702 RepID=Q9LG36_ARATH|nr:F14J16.1 [Arabidopsis thaliana]